MSSNEYSKIGKELVEQGHSFTCPYCNSPLSGERYCPNCNKKISYPNEENNLEKFGKGLQSFGSSMEKTGNSMSNFGCSMMLGCTIPVIIIILLLLFL